MTSVKKVVLGCAVIFAGALAFGQSWSHLAGLALAAPVYSFNVREEGAKTAFAPQVSARYYGERDNGFCLTGTASAGVLISKDFKLDAENDVAAGLALGLSLGAGYAFHASDAFTFAVLGSLSFDCAKVSKKKELTAALSYGTVTTSWTQNETLLSLGLGVEALGIYKLTDRVSLWGSLAVRFIDAGTLIRNGENQGRNYSKSFEVRGNVSVTPSFGAAWSF